MVPGFTVVAHWSVIPEWCAAEGGWVGKMQQRIPEVSRVNSNFDKGESKLQNCHFCEKNNQTKIDTD